MAIAPIDLQTLYTQMDKVSKTVIQQQQGAALQNSMILDAKLQKEILELLKLQNHLKIKDLTFLQSV